MRPYAPFANPPATFFSFGFPDISVEIHFSVLRDLEIVATGDDISAPWGLLLGRRTGSRESVIVEAAEPVISNCAFGSTAAIEHWQPNPERRLYAVGYYRYFKALQDGEVELLPAENDLISQWFTGEALALHLRRRGGKVTGRLWNIMPESEPGALDFPIGVSPASIGPAVAPPVESAIPYGQPIIPYVRPDVGAPRVSHGSGLRKWLWPGLGAAAFAAAFLVWSIAEPAGQPKPGIAQRLTGPLELNIEPVDDAVNLTWNPGAQAFLSAHGAVLWVTEDGVSRNLVLDATKLRTGSLLYSPSGSNIMFRMEVFGSGEPVEESVRLLRTGMSPGGNQALPEERTRAARARQEQAAPEVTAPRAETSAPTTGRTAGAVRTFVAPKRTPAEQRPAISAPPAVPIAGASARLEALPEAIRSGPRVPPLPARPTSESSVSEPQARPVVSNLIPPRPLYREQPRLTPSQILSAPAAISVDVDIDEKGGVVNAAAAAGQPTSTYYATAAVRAAARWRFAPAELNGRKIPSKMTLQFIFRSR